MILFNEKDGEIETFKIEISDEAIKESAYRYFNVDDIFPDEDIIRYTRENYNPEDVFSIEDLSFWAEGNGYSTKD